MDRGECVDFLTGGAGGCCSARDTPAGFVAMTWDLRGEQHTECFVPDRRCTIFNYYRGGGEKEAEQPGAPPGAPAEGDEEGDLEPEVPENCGMTLDNPRCANYLPPDPA